MIDFNTSSNFNNFFYDKEYEMTLDGYVSGTYKMIKDAYSPIYNYGYFTLDGFTEQNALAVAAANAGLGNVIVSYLISEIPIQLLNQSQDADTTVSMQNPYLFDGISYSDNRYIGVNVGEYKFTGVTTSHPLGFVINDT